MCGTISFILYLLLLNDEPNGGSVASDIALSRIQQNTARSFGKHCDVHTSDVHETDRTLEGTSCLLHIEDLEPHMFSIIDCEPILVVDENIACIGIPSNFWRL